MTMDRRRNRSVLWTLVAVLLLAYVLRVIGLANGQPSRAGLPDEQAIGSLSPFAPIHPDEYDYVSRPLYMLLRGVRNPEFFHNPALFIYLNYGFYALSGLGHYTHVDGYDVRIYAPFHLYPQGRMTSVLAGVLGVALVFYAARRPFGTFAAVIAALLMAVSFIYSQHGHYGKSSELAGAMVAGAVGFSLRLLYLKRPGYLAYILPGVFVGLAGASRYNDALVGLVYAGCAGVVFLRQPRTWKPALVGLVTAPVVFLATNPYVLRDFSNFYAQFTFITTLYRTYDGPYAAYFPFSLYAEYRYFFIFGLGPPGFLVALWGIVAAYRRRPRWRNFFQVNSPLLVTAILLLYVAVYSFTTLTPRNLGEQLLVPMVPVFALWAGYGLDRLLTPFRDPMVRRRAAWVGAAVLVAWPLYLSADYAGQLARPDTRDLAALWIEAHVPAGTAVHLLGPYNVPLDPAQYPYTFNVACSESMDDCPSLEDIRAEGAEIIVYSDAWFHDWLRSAEFVDPAFLDAMRAYLDRLDSGLVELARFERPIWPGWDMPMHTASYWYNPTIVIYTWPTS